MSPKKNITNMRYSFFAYNKDEGQPIDQYVAVLKYRGEHCEFGDLKHGATL